MITNEQAAAMAVVIPPNPEQQFAEAFLAFQKEAPAIPRDREGQLGNRKYKYSDLATVIEKIDPILNKHGLTHRELPSMVVLNGQLVTAVTVRISHVGGHYEDTVLAHPFTEGEDVRDQGQKITYLRRYGLIATLGLVTEDDLDGEPATGQKKSSNKAAPGPVDDDRPKGASRAQEKTKSSQIGANALTAMRELCKGSSDPAELGKALVAKSRSLFGMDLQGLVEAVETQTVPYYGPNMDQEERLITGDQAFVILVDWAETTEWLKKGGKK